MVNIFHKLTHPQKSILLTEQFNESTCISNICGSLSIDQKIDIRALEKAINLFVKINDSVRLNLFSNGSEIYQFVKDYSFFMVEKIALSDSYSLSNLEEDVISKPFPLLDCDLYRFVIFKNSDGTGGFVANLHHIISDAWTMSLLIDQIISFYSSLLSGQTLEEIENAQNLYSYIDFIQEEQKYLESPKCEKAKLFWEQQFDHFNASYLLDVQSSSYTAERKCITLSKELSDELNDFCKNHNMSLFVLFMGALAIYLSKINNSSFATIGTPILNRSNFREKHTTGMFISTVPFCLEFDPSLNCLDFLALVLKKEISIFRYQKYPYDLLLDSIRKKFNISKNLYDVSLSYQNAKDHKNNSEVSYSTKWLFNHCISNNLDIHIYDMDDTGFVHIYYDFKKEILNVEDISLLNESLLCILKQMISEPYQKISKIEVITEQEKHFIFNQYNDTARNLVFHHSNDTNLSFVSVYDKFKEQVVKNPEKPAICYKDDVLSYADLNHMANLIAVCLQKSSIQRGDIICLAFEHSIEFIASVIATQKLGACYIPIDINYPTDRIEYIVNSSDSKLLLTNTDSWENIHIDKEFILKLNYSSSRHELICSEFSTSYNESIPLCDYATYPDISTTLNPDDLAYIIYTSGSTGKPKGVKISHKSLSNYIFWAISEYVKSEETNFPFFSSIAFDLTVTSIFTPLCSGNCIYVYQNENPQLLFQEIVEDRKVQIVKLTPGHFNLLQDIDLSHSVITKFILGGDILTKEICSKISSLFSHDVHIYNEYGPTEATVGCMIYEYNKSDPYVSVPIGVPISNTKIYLLNDNLELVPLGHIGEIYIAGDCLALGYTDDLKTKEKFLSSPFEDGQILYKTGDTARLHKNGIMEYVGRVDFQVKLNGYRIELGEIQSHLLAHPLLKDAYVTVLTYSNHKFLCAYYISDCEVSDLARYLSKSLPSYMIPNYFIRLDSIPLTVNGKVDKSSLPIPKKVKREYIAPKNHLEETFQSVFTNLLDLEHKLSVEDSIFDYYVDSLSLIKVQAMLYAKGIKVNIQDFYEYKTIRDLSNFLLEHSHGTATYLSGDMPSIHEIVHLNEHTISKFNTIVLFGATGFLGIHILKSLLMNTNCKIYCIIRKKQHIRPLDRFFSKFTFYFPSIDLDKYLYRIKIVEGNILEDFFGLDEDLYHKIGNLADCVIDTAALVKHYGNYEMFSETNVNSTKRMLAFCKNFQIPFHYISTISVSGYGLVWVPSSDFYETDLYIGQKFDDNVYVKSKFEAEKLIIEACSNDDISVSIYRVGTITNRYMDGKFQENFKDNAFLNRLKAFIDLGVFPDTLSDFNFEFTPVDYCADFIVRLLDKQKYNLNIYHLFNENYITCQDLVQFFYDLDIPIQPVSLQDFQKILSESKNNYFGVTAYLKNMDCHVTIHNESTNMILNDLALKWPLIDKNYIAKILNYINNCNGGSLNEIK